MKLANPQMRCLSTIRVVDGAVARGGEA